MLAQQIGGMVIVLIGLGILGASFPVLRYSAGRAHSIPAQIGSNMLTWLICVFGSLVIILGVVTLAQR